MAATITHAHQLRDLGGPRGWDGTGYHYECSHCGRKFVRKPAGAKIIPNNPAGVAHHSEAKEAA